MISTRGNRPTSDDYKVIFLSMTRNLPPTKGDDDSSVPMEHVEDCVSCTWYGMVSYRAIWATRGGQLRIPKEACIDPNNMLFNTANNDSGRIRSDCHSIVHVFSVIVEARSPTASPTKRLPSGSA